MNRPQLLSADEISEHLRDLPLWQHKESTLVREVATADFASAVGVVVAVAMVAEAMDHHPDILIYGWNKVRIVTTTHDCGGLTILDVRLARRVDAISFQPQALS